MQLHIDSLVAGELSDDQRAELFAWCDQEPNRWRLCALAFIEAQTWRQGLAAWMKESESSSMTSTSSAATTASATLAAPRQRWTSNRWANWATMAACLLLAFFAGVLVRDPKLLRPRSTADGKQQQVVMETPEQPPATTYVTVPIQTNFNPGVSNLLQIPVVDSANATRPQKRELPDYVLKQWERQGYEVAQTERFLNAKLPDGRAVVVPVSGLAVKYVGKPVY